MPVEGTEGHAMGPMGQKRRKGVPVSGNRGCHMGFLWSHGTEGKEKTVGL